jgi:hypothetical protein
MMVRRLRVAVIAVIAGWMVAVSAQQQPQQPQAPRDTSARPAAAAATPATARLSGRVVASESGKPIKRARVFINVAELGGRAMLTDDNGVYEFSDLPAGRYTINASKSGYIQLSYGQRRPLQAGTPLQLVDGQQLRNIDFALPKGGVISGRVADETGNVMPGVAVQVLRYQSQQGERRAVPAGQAQTDDRGIYRVWGLNPGNYYVSAVPRQDGFGGRGGANPNAGGGGRGGRGGRGGDAAPGRGGAAAAGDDQDQLMYAPTYYPGVPSIGEARAVTVGVSQEVVDIDFGLQLVRTARVSGHLENPDGSWTAQGNVTLMPQSGSRGGAIGNAFGGRIGWDGQFSVANVPPGLYTLRARNNDRDAPLSSSQPLSVNGDVDNVLVVLQKGGSLSGSLVFQPGSTNPPSDVTQVRITAPAVETEDNVGPNPNSRVNKDGTFTLDGVSVGDHLIRPNGGLRGWNLKSVTVDGRDVTDIPIAVRSNQRINNVVVTFTDKISEIDGTVTDVQGNGVTEYTVLAFSTNPAVWRPNSRQIATTRPDQTGMFKIRNLPAGEYYVVAVDPSEPGEWFDPAYLDQHRAGAARVTLGDGDVKTQDFRVQR